MIALSIPVVDCQRVDAGRLGRRMKEGSEERKVLGGRKGLIGIEWEVGVTHVMTICRAIYG